MTAPRADLPACRPQALMATATKLKDLHEWNGPAAVYVLSKPLCGHNYVVVSTVLMPHSNPETYIFGADANADNVNFLELNGSYCGALNHEAALNSAGYEVT